MLRQVRRRLKGLAQEGRIKCVVPIIEKKIDGL